MISRLAASPWRYLLFALLLTPSAWYLATNSDLPNFGDFHDATLYFVNAKSLAETGEYRIASLPEHPYQTKYPPLYPWVLSWIWRLNPDFPSNLTPAAWLTWCSMPLLILWLLPKQWARWGLTPGRIAILAALFAFNPYVIWLSSSLLTELQYMVLCVSAMLLVERAREKDSVMLPLAAGFVGAMAYLTRTAGIALLPAAVVYLWFRSEQSSRLRKVLCFAAAMVPIVAGWLIWSRMRLVPSSDPALTYYIDYMGYQKLNVSLSDLPLVLWKNVDGFLWGLGSLVIPKVDAALIIKILAQVTAVAMISGVVRLVRQGKAELFAGFGLISSVMLLIWHYPPDERFVMPLFPIAFAGLVTELSHVSGIMKLARQHKDRSQRVVAAGMTGLAAAIGCGAIVYHVWVAFSHLPDDAAQHRARSASFEEAFRWVETNTPPGTAFLADRDPLLYLYTGRTATSRPLLPRFWYHDDHEAMVKQWATIGEFAQQRGLRYYFTLDSEGSRGLDSDDSETVEKAIRNSPDLQPVFRSGPVAIYRFAGANAIQASAPDPAGTRIQHLQPAQ